jgi:hypothetical protein
MIACTLALDRADGRFGFIIGTGGGAVPPAPDENERQDETAGMGELVLER